MAIVSGASGGQLATRYSESGGTLHVVSGGFQYVDLYPHEPSEAAGTSVDADIELPEDARIHRALFELKARATGATTISSVAEVRAANPVTTGSVACAVDFGRLVTVAGLQVPQLSLVFLSKVFFWTGTAWGSARTSIAFPDVQTERLLIESDSDGLDADELAAYVTNHVDVMLPVTPSGLELQLDGTTVWFERQGSSVDEPLPALGGGVAYVVDRTDAARDAFDRALPSDGVRKVRATLRVAVPGALSLTPKPFVLRVHTVQFPPEGLTRTVDVGEEGVIGFDVTPPPSAAEVRGVELVVRGSFGPERVQPATGPPAEPDARLVVSPGRVLLAGIPNGLLGRFAVISGVRLHMSAISGGGVLAARLLSDTGGRPGDEESRREPSRH